MPAIRSRLYLEAYANCLQAEEIVDASTPDKEYLPITGLAEFTKNAALLAYGSESEPLKQGAVCLPVYAELLLP